GPVHDRARGRREGAAGTGGASLDRRLAGRAARHRSLPVRRAHLAVRPVEGRNDAPGADAGNAVATEPRDEAPAAARLREKSVTLSGLTARATLKRDDSAKCVEVAGSVWWPPPSLAVDHR